MFMKHNDFILSKNPREATATIGGRELWEARRRARGVGLSTIRNPDQIYVPDQGCIVDRGIFDQLGRPEANICRYDCPRAGLAAPPQAALWSAAATPPLWLRSRLRASKNAFYRTRRSARSQSAVAAAALHDTFRGCPRFFSESVIPLAAVFTCL